MNTKAQILSLKYSERAKINLCAGRGGDVIGINELISTLKLSISAVKLGEKHESACCALVASTMKGTGIRPKIVGATISGERIYLLNLAQAEKLLARALQAHG